MVLKLGWHLNYRLYGSAFGYGYCQSWEKKKNVQGIHHLWGGGTLPRVQVVLLDESAEVRGLINFLISSFWGGGGEDTPLETEP